MKNWDHRIHQHILVNQGKELELFCFIFVEVIKKFMGSVFCEVTLYLSTRDTGGVFQSNQQDVVGFDMKRWKENRSRIHSMHYELINMLDVF